MYIIITNGDKDKLLIARYNIFIFYIWSDRDENNYEDYDVSDIVLPDGVVPLCWQDQLNIPNVKVVESGSPRPETSRYVRLSQIVGYYWYK